MLVKEEKEQILWKYFDIQKSNSNLFFLIHIINRECERHKKKLFSILSPENTIKREDCDWETAVDGEGKEQKLWSICYYWKWKLTVENAGPGGNLKAEGKIERSKEEKPK